MDSLLSRYFTTDNPSQAYPATTPSRAGLPDQQLLFDRLLQLAQIDAVLYPPRDFTGLRKLLSAISDSDSFDSLKKDCLVYYLLKDYKDGREHDFSRSKRIPARFVASTDAYWLLDNAQYEQGVKKLCSPGVVPDFMSAILATLYSRLDESELASTLILHLVNFTEPSLQQEQDIQIVINASIIKGRVESAWKWMRRAVDGAPVEEEGDRLKLLSQSIGHILDLCFTALPPLSKALEQLLYLPMTPEEDEAVLAWVADATTSTKGAPRASLPDRTLPLINEWITSRLIAHGRYVEAITILSNSMTSLRTSPEGTKKAQDTVKDLYNILPPVQRSMVDLALSSPAATKAMPNGVPAGDAKAASAKITQLPWLPTPSLPALPVPRSLIQAHQNATLLKTLKEGGMPLDRTLDLPISASGLLSRATSTAAPGDAKARATDAAGRAPALNAEGKRDERIQLLSAVRHAESPRKAPSNGFAGIRHSGSNGGASPFRSASPLPASAHSQNLRQREESPFTAATLLNQPSPASHRPTVQGFGAVRPQPGTPGNVARLDFSDQLRKLQHQHQQQQEQADRSALSGPLKTSTPTKSLTGAQYPKFGDNEPIARDASRAGSVMGFPNQSAARSSGKGRSLPPGAFGPVNSDSSEDEDEGEGRDENDEDHDRVLNETLNAPPPARSTRSAVRRQSSVPPNTTSDEQASKKGRRQKANAQNKEPLVNPTPAKKGKKNTSARSTASKSKAAAPVEPTPRRSKRLGSVVPSESGPDEDARQRQLLEEEDDIDEEVEDSMIDRGTRQDSRRRGKSAQLAKTPRSRKA